MRGWTAVGVSALVALSACSAPDAGVRTVGVNGLEDRGVALPDDPDVRTGTLPNGLTYFLRHNERPGAEADLRLVVDAGSMLEQPDQAGVAHFLEHMMFNGT